MIDISQSILIPIGVITASIIAGLFSFVSLIMSKEQKVCEFRRDWIEAFRAEVWSIH